MSLACGKLVYKTRELAASLINAPKVESCIFCFNCTDALNTAIKGVLRPGMHVVTSQIEHNSVLRVLKTMEKRGFIRLTVVAPRPDGIISAEAIAAAINRRTRLIVLTHASNVLGTVQPIAAVGALCRARGIIFLVDAAQSAGVLDIDLQKMNIDMLATAGHKGLYGPQGTGILYISPDISADTLKEGGTGTSSELLYQPHEMPERFESGTLNTPGIAGLYAGMRFTIKNKEDIRRNERRLCEFIYEGLSNINGVKIYGTDNFDKRVGVISFNYRDVQSGIIADELNLRNIAVRAGLHCAPGCHEFMGTTDQGAVRISLGAFNTLSEAQFLLDSLKEILC
jgi:cysteine desulfurase/selenocysteine lyase